MKLKYRKLPYRPWPVTVKLQECDEDTGEVVDVPQTFIGHFRPFTEEDVLAKRLEIFGDETEPETTKRLGNMPVAEYAKLEARFFQWLMCGWSKMTDDADTEIPYTDAALFAFTTGEDGSLVRRALNTAANEIRYGWAPAKNSKPSPVPGPDSSEGAAPTS
jgi:hypothetical protein